jgi:hypothetical protein
VFNWCTIALRRLDMALAIIHYTQKDGRVQWISDFRELNKHIEHKVYNLPKIQDTLNRQSGYKYFTKLDISMQYYTFELDECSKQLCTICTLFGNYRYNQLPMGISQAQIFLRKLWKTFFVHSLKWMYISTTLESSPMTGIVIANR